jgi:hypothetical protein
MSHIHRDYLNRREANMIILRVREDVYVANCWRSHTIIPPRIPRHENNTVRKGYRIGKALAAAASTAGLHI